ncbi:hypothetical protein [Bradyrhizobium sp. CCBAU 45389]|uniref:hypothetical protein n=1 Tax=Bradyrhizobium sp. CCBAU 45389 TaxID=858429 RepID=UPI002306BA53|nr:hypothetical protein [Bradyrhizobium sp. CCBAU 45389]
MSWFPSIRRDHDDRLRRTRDAIALSFGKFRQGTTRHGDCKTADRMHVHDSRKARTIRALQDRSPKQKSRARMCCKATR